MSLGEESLGWKASKGLESLKHRPGLAQGLPCAKSPINSLEGMVVAGLQCLSASI